MAIEHKLGSALVGLALAVTIATSAKAGEYRADGYRIPDISSAKHTTTSRADAMPTYPGKETTIKGYVKKDGTYFKTLEFRGQLYGILIDTNGRMPVEYGLLDQTGDGVFRHKINTKESWPDPTWFK